MLQAEQLKNHDLVATSGNRFFGIPKRLDQIWDPINRILGA
jgi:hypothetical protein